MCYTFGAPRTGNHTFAKECNAAVPETWNIMNARYKLTPNSCSSSYMLRNILPRLPCVCLPCRRMHVPWISNLDHDHWKAQAVLCLRPFAYPGTLYLAQENSSTSTKLMDREVRPGFPSTPR